MSGIQVLQVVLREQTVKMHFLKKKFRRSIGEIKHIFEFIDEFTHAHGVQKKTVHDVSLAVEEIFTNMVKYNPGGPSQVEMRLAIADNTLRIEMIDHEKHPFDITQSQVYDLAASVHERPVGRLGLHFVKNVMDDLAYHHQKNRTVITMIKHLGETNV